jgi:YidC/Oxa1 family membrane protein insertase
VPVADPSYVSLQTNNRNTDNAIVVTPGGVEPGVGDPLSGIALGERRVAMQVPFDGEARLTVDMYLGKNELVRFYQEGYADLPGLFNPNILGRMSLWILIALEFIHSYVEQLGAVDHRADAAVPRAGVAADHHPDAVDVRDAEAAAGAAEAAEEVQGGPREADPGDDEALQGGGRQPRRRLPADPVQMPLFIILWRVFVNFEFNEGFLWIPDLGLPDPWYILPALYVRSCWRCRGSRPRATRRCCASRS